jgi:hypothetical protein
MPNNIKELLHCWKEQGRGHPKEIIWKVISALLIWSIWGEMNRRIFEDSETNVFFLKSSFLRSLLGWVLVNVPNFVSTNLVDLISFLHCSSL